MTRRRAIRGHQDAEREDNSLPYTNPENYARDVDEEEKRAVRASGYDRTAALMVRDEVARGVPENVKFSIAARRVALARRKHHFIPVETLPVSERVSDVLKPGQYTITPGSVHTHYQAYQVPTNREGRTIMPPSLMRPDDGHNAKSRRREKLRAAKSGEEFQTGKKPGLENLDLEERFVVDNLHGYAFDSFTHPRDGDNAIKRANSLPVPHHLEYRPNQDLVVYWYQPREHRAAESAVNAMQYRAKHGSLTTKPLTPDYTETPKVKKGSTSVPMKFTPSKSSPLPTDHSVVKKNTKRAEKIARQRERDSPAVNADV
jgi:hypothetical protein